MKEAEDRPAGTDRPPAAAAHRPVTRRQYRYVRWLCSEHELRAESVSHHMMGLDLDRLDRAGASQLIDYLEAYGESAEAAARGREIKRQFGLSLLRVERRDESLITPALPNRTIASQDVGVGSVAGHNIKY